MSSPGCEELFYEALKRSSADRTRFLFEACQGDWDLFAEVRALIRYHDESDPMMDAHRTADERIRDTLSRTKSLSPGQAIETPLASYRIRELVGEGGMGLVYVADQTKPLRRRVALKVMKFGLDSDRARLRFESERQALALMSHPSIARVFEAGTTESEQMFLAMEYVPGREITRFCDEERLSIAERVELFARVCHGVQHAHQKGVLHRDLKPSNVLVTTEHGSRTPKIIDFGVAKFTNVQLAERTVDTGAGVFVGSVKYLSPEQIDTRVFDVDTRSDVYSLGVLLYELLTGVHPLDICESGQIGYPEIERRIRYQDPLPPSRRIAELGEGSACASHERRTSISALTSTLSGELDWIITKALEKDRSRRYASASELAADLGRFLANDPVLAGPRDTTYRLRMFARRHRRFVVSASIVLATLSLGLVASVSLLIENREVMEVSQQQRSDIRRLGDTKRLETLLEEADRLAPPHPEIIPAAESWIRVADDLASRMSLHRATLAQLELKGHLATTRPDAQAGASPRIQFEDAREEFQYRVVSRLVADLEEFMHPETGTYADVVGRLAFAHDVQHQSFALYGEEWRTAITAISDPAICPQYEGLRLTPQLGLVPLGPDPATGLWEFAHLYSGTPPSRSADGTLEVDEETGLVLILIPRGCFYMGASEGVDAGIDAQTGDPLAREDEEPPHRVCLDAFFISKYEMTQSGWLRISNDRPSMFPRAPLCRGTWRPGLHPVENVSWDQAARVMLLAGLVLPTEAQWEYAARGGTPSPWWTGWDSGEMETMGNFADACRAAIITENPKPDLPDDGFGETAPVGAFPPNPFGLHDALGNVFEWCRDYYGSYSLATAPGDGLRDVEWSRDRVVRGSDFTHSARASRVSWRINLSPGSRVRIGVRPARAVQR